MRGSIPAVIEMGVGGGQWVRLIDGRSSVEGSMDPQGLERAWAELRPMVQAGADREAARRLGMLFDEPAMTELRGRLVALRNQADAARVPFRVLVDAQTERLRALPWELLEDARGLPPAQWLRVMPIESTAPFAHSGAGRRYVSLEVVLCSAEPEDLMVRSLLVRLEALLRGINGVTVFVLPRDTQLLAPLPAPSTFRVVHTVNRSLAALDRVRIQGAGLVFLDQLGVDPTESFPALLRQGASAVVGLASEPDVSINFARATYQALVQGQDLVDAVGEGRKTLRGHPWLRSWSARMMVTTPAAVTQPAPLRRHPLPGQWPTAAADADEVLDQAVELANGSGFLGVEHLAAAVVRVARPSPLISLALPCLQLVAAMLVPTESDGRLRLSPRMDVLVRLLREGFTLDDLVAQLLLVPWVAGILGEPLVRRIRELVPPVVTTADDPTQPAPVRGGGMALEVMGGPDDGRVLLLTEPDQVLGRWDPNVSSPTTLKSGPAVGEALPELPGRSVPAGATLYPGVNIGQFMPSVAPPDDRSRLFVGGRVVERTVSRRHLAFVPPRSVRVTAPTQRLHDQGSEVLNGVVELRPGDRLLLGIGTRLKVLGE
jgi:hypothetical protein